MAKTMGLEKLMKNPQQKSKMTKKSCSIFLTPRTIMMTGISSKNWKHFRSQNRASISQWVPGFFSPNQEVHELFHFCNTVIEIAVQNHPRKPFDIGLQKSIPQKTDLALLVIAWGGHHPLVIAFGSHFNLDWANWLWIGWQLIFKSFLFVDLFCFAYSLSKMALKLTSKKSIQVFFWNSSFFPEISDNLWLGGKHSWLWIGSTRFKSRLDHKFFIGYFCCLKIFSLCDKYSCCQKYGLLIL